MANELDAGQESPAGQGGIAEVLGLGPKQARRRRVRGIVGSVLALGVLIGVLVWWTRPKPPVVPDYQTELVKRGSVTVVVTATGTLSAREAVDVGAEITGRVLKVNVDFNDRVTKGQVLAEIDPEQYRARVDESQAQLSLASASVKNAQATAREEELNIARARSMHEAGLTSKQALEQAEATYERSQAAVASARAQLTSAGASMKVNRTNLSKALILSPIDGIVLERSVEPGQTVTSGLQTPVLFTLAADLAELRLDVKVDEADVGQVRQGLDATFTVDAYPNREFRSTVLAVKNMPTTDQNVVTYEARLSVNNEEGLLRPGMTATATIVVSRGQADALLVPNAALRFTPPAPKAPGASPSAEKTKESSGPLITKLMPRPGRGSGSQSKAAGTMVAGRQGSRGSGKNGPSAVWVLQGGKVSRIPVEIGLSDGVLTEVTSSGLREGSSVVVGVSENADG